MREPVKVGYVLKKFPRLSETFILNEILELERQGQEVHVLSLYPPDDGRFHSGVAALKNPIVYLPDMSLRECFRYLARRRQQLGPMLDRIGPALDYVLSLGEESGTPVLKRALAVALEIERLGISHLHAHFATIAARTALVVKMLTGTSYSVTAHAKDIYSAGVDAEEFAWLVDESSFFVTVCDANRDYILERLAPGRERKVARLYNGVDLARFAPRQDERVAAPHSLVAVGRLVAKKGFHVLLDACAELARRGTAFDCAIVGDGEEREALEAQRERLGLGGRVRFLGALPQEQVIPLYRDATLAVLPCVTDAEGNRDALPTTLLEALACGLPVVSSPVGGVAEIVDHAENGLLVPENDAGALANAISELFDAAPMRQSFGAAGRRKAERVFDLSQNVAELGARFQGRLRPSPARSGAAGLPAAAAAPAAEAGP